MSPIQYPNSSLRSTISQDFANQPLPEMIAAPIGSLPRPTVGQSDTCRRLGAVQTPSSLHVGDRFPACKGYECRTEVPDSGGTKGHSATAVAALAQMRYTRPAAGLPATPAQAYEVEECNSDDDQDVASADELDITHVETPNQVISLPGVSSLLMGINAPNKRSAPGANSLEFLAKWPICNRGMSLARGRSRAGHRVEFRDALGSFLFRDILSSDYILEDVFFQYYPNAPRNVIFYTYDQVALPRQTSLGYATRCYGDGGDTIVIWVRQPASADSDYEPRWST
ncbi:hypothetical protein DL89DRAFT_83221 [Linderina pennispora]|uniref:Uncharacterized protein n=1 Tax=Linderina pennispora TaxID=61395 RepID=A0A1Y1WHF6_9FUNG|nr:uncharacterized protein DL89DRAFT_83221 [Linderina pennispora]ORX72815.1 hypothetical protein DL89DRAFT_83221 [Linderina pennispora]